MQQCFVQDRDMIFKSQVFITTYKDIATKLYSQGYDNSQVIEPLARPISQLLEQSYLHTSIIPASIYAEYNLQQYPLTR